MKYKKEENKITIYGLEDFNIEHILMCGQVFRFFKNGEIWTVFSGDKKAEIKEFREKDQAEIITQDTEYFIKYFDLDTNYGVIKKKLKSYDLNFLNKAIDTFYGIRILNQDVFETFFSFMISQNNNIKRIQTIIERLCKKSGEKIDDYYAFPTFSEMKKLSQQDFLDLGLGYRASYFVKSLAKMEENTLYNLKSKDGNQIKKELLSFCGVGEKVADCILLFGYGFQEFFPCDVWIENMYNEYFKIETSRETISKNLVNLFGNLSGYAQQYLFFYIRSQKEDKKD
ncbi:MAG: DNA-3-methyladenine glycosylase 2 family protein [Clostridia bacterium]|nr:DNA-3-methyladenine glycosylase 2 family protein [Clostridia bacterium]